jgi:hypothetical protein
VQDLGQRRLHARAFAGGQHQDFRWFHQTLSAPSAR